MSARRGRNRRLMRKLFSQGARGSSLSLEKIHREANCKSVCGSSISASPTRPGGRSSGRSGRAARAVRRGSAAAVRRPAAALRAGRRRRCSVGGSRGEQRGGPLRCGRPRGGRGRTESAGAGGGDAMPQIRLRFRWLVLASPRAADTGEGRLACVGAGARGARGSTSDDVCLDSVCVQMTIEFPPIAPPPPPPTSSPSLPSSSLPSSLSLPSLPPFPAPLPCPPHTKDCTCVHISLGCIEVIAESAETPWGCWARPSRPRLNEGGRAPNRPSTVLERIAAPPPNATPTQIYFFLYHGGREGTG